MKSITVGEINLLGLCWEILKINAQVKIVLALNMIKNHITLKYCIYM